MTCTPANRRKHTREWATPDLEDLAAYKGFNGARALRFDVEDWEANLTSALVCGWEWGIYETAMD